MLILTKTLVSIMLGFVIAIILGSIILPILKSLKAEQNVSRTLNERHLKKQGTPTMGGLIFILSTLIILIFLFINGSLKISFNFLIILFVFFSYALLGGADDAQKIIFKNNKGLSIIFKFGMQILIALIFFAIFILAGNNTTVDFGLFTLDLKFLYGFLILFILTGASNAVNITDGLDGLCAGLCAISFLSYGIIAYNSPYIIGYEEIAIFCFILAGSLIGFLFYNFYPAKVFMGDLGSLCLGATLGAIAIILKKEMSLILIGLIYIFETLTSFIQIIAIRVFHKKIFKKSPFHHHLEEIGFVESDIIKIFYTVGLLFSLIAILLYVWH